MTTADAPDWSGVLYPPPLLLGTLTIPLGQKFIQGAFTPPPGATGLVVLAAQTAPTRQPFTQVDISNLATQVLLAHAESDYNGACIAACGVAGAAAGQVLVALTWSVAQTTTGVVDASVFAVFGSEVATAVATAEQPVAVSRGRGVNHITDTTNIINFTTVSSGDQLVATLAPNGPPALLLRKCDMQVSAASTVVASTWSLYLKGVTSGTTRTLVSGATAAGSTAPITRPLDLEDHPIDLSLAFPADASVQLRLNNPVNTVAAAMAVVTP